MRTSGPHLDQRSMTSYSLVLGGVVVPVLSVPHAQGAISVTLSFSKSEGKFTEDAK